jgi:MFS family permease
VKIFDTAAANGTALDPQRGQRRTVWVLSSAQLLSGIGSGASLSVGSLPAVQLSGASARAGSVATTMTLGAAAAALPLAGLAGRRGRRASLVTGLLAAMAGALLVIVSWSEKPLACRHWPVPSCSRRPGWHWPHSC